MPFPRPNWLGNGEATCYLTAKNQPNSDIGDGNPGDKTWSRRMGERMGYRRHVERTLVPQEEPRRGKVPTSS